MNSYFNILARRLFQVQCRAVASRYRSYYISLSSGLIFTALSSAGMAILTLERHDYARQRYSPGRHCRTLTSWRFCEHNAALGYLSRGLRVICRSLSSGRTDGRTSTNSARHRSSRAYRFLSLVGSHSPMANDGSALTATYEPRPRDIWTLSTRLRRPLSSYQPSHSSATRRTRWGYNCCTSVIFLPFFSSWRITNPTVSASSRVQNFTLSLPPS